MNTHTHKHTHTHTQTHTHCSWLIPLANSDADNYISHLGASDKLSIRKNKLLLLLCMFVCVYVCECLSVCAVVC